jgi:hypothetical protein
MPDRQGVSLVGGREPLAHSFRFTDHALGNFPHEQEIISDGNLVLIIGAGEKRVRITVQAARVSSSVLSDMLDGRNITGADNTGRVFELRLPDDDATAARNAFGSIYPGNPHADDLSPGEIYDVVIFARKYKMIPEFRKVASNWFRPRYCGRHFHPAHRFFGLEDCWYLMMAAYYMVLSDLPDFRFEFSNLSERLVRDERAYYNCRLHVRVPHAHSIEADIYCKIFFLLHNT